METVRSGVRIGIDVGGTFTDFVLSGAGGEMAFYKEPSTPDDPSRALIEGLGKLLDQTGMAPGDVSSLMHGTTIGLNAIIQRKGARIGLIVTSGYRDILEIARCRMPSSFDLHAAKEVPLVPRARIVEIAARLSPSGEVTIKADDAEIARVGGELAALDIDAAALVLINGYASPDHEAELARKISAAANGLQITSAASIWPEIREYERTLVACLNAYIQPLIRTYFERLGKGLQERGITAPILVTASNGGSLSIASAVERPVETILSGPASGVMAAVRLAQATGVHSIITFDMGGTSSDIAIASGGMPELATRTDIGGLPLVLPVVDVSAIGAGGGSIVWVDPHGVLKVGPQSAGARPGPVSYRQGGTESTVTDCYLTLGYIDPDGFLGGRMKLDGTAARDALAAVGAKIGIEGDAADRAARTAEGALSVTTAGMASALHKTLAERGLDPRGFALVPFGGAGPTHANLLAEEVGILHVVVPPAAGTFCALGAAGADFRRDFVRSLRRPLVGNAGLLFETFDALSRDGRAWLEAEGGVQLETRFERSLDMRYAGQAYELRVRLEPGIDDAGAVAEAFHREHERIYGFRDPDAVIELGTVRLAAVGVTPDLPTPRLAGGASVSPPKGKRLLFHRGGWVEASIYARSALAPGQSLEGPAIVEQEDTTVIVLPRWNAHVDEVGNLHLESAAR
ncbi:hydantoinase/oxoprolinase family protein [Chelativorans sp. AA-79]|uniref:hydantoinase/oxoprolinase family protein n=1 Tax=Chelativorans sp. AA-79 TaxID=3028735 RepID=UPI0023F90934|nr:hydantoinase/oxoprolinase family protein [Chelativorans sp. AA-79]WEX08904.1 hydantoinase/oxoprolinase family protein [Chelativorans sp. AA-79]